MADLIRACDVVVQNAGGLTTSEALASGVPVLTYRCLSGHGRRNAAVLSADGTVPWVRSPDDFAAGLVVALAGRDATWTVRPSLVLGAVG
jgi:UDP-N-acetylglucosamine:LPS N-acetylglucosamine transferase